jgi:hypothetical protein
MRERNAIGWSSTPTANISPISPPSQATIRERIEARQRFVRDELGIPIKESILPLSSTPLCLPPSGSRVDDCWRLYDGGGQEKSRRGGGLTGRLIQFREFCVNRVD